VTALRAGLPALPRRIAQLPIDDRGYPVPWFVHWADGKPDFRVVGSGKVRAAIQHSACWICGQTLGSFKTFLIGPMCAINRISGEPPSHTECARFAAAACPFLVRPLARRREAGIPEESSFSPTGLTRNPGVALLWTTAGYRAILGLGGEVLFRLLPPVPPAERNVEWWREGRRATREEVLESIESGYPALFELAEKDGPDAVTVLERQRAAAAELYPR